MIIYTPKYSFSKLFQIFLITFLMLPATFQASFGDAPTVLTEEEVSNLDTTQFADAITNIDNYNDATKALLSARQSSEHTSASIWNPTFALCGVYSYAAGPIGKTLALLCLVMIGISFFMSKVSWTTALSVALGIAAIFGAPTIVNLLTGGGGDGCSITTKGGTETPWEIDQTYAFGATTKVTV